MLLSSSRFICMVSLSLSFAATGIASSADVWSDDLEQRGDEILEAYQYVARGAFDDLEEYEAREYVDVDDIPERRSSEDNIKRSIDSHGYPHDSWRQKPFGNGRRGVRLEERDDSEDGLERRSIFPHDTKIISSLRKQISQGRKASEARKARRARKAAKAKAAAAKEEQEELEAREAWRIIREFERREAEQQLAAREQARRAAVARRTLDRIIYQARQLAEEEESLAAREYEEELAAREFEENDLNLREIEELLVKARQLADEEELAIRTVVEEPPVAARDATEAPIEARAPADASEANVLQAREPINEEAPVAREVAAPPADDLTKRDVQEEPLQAREGVDGEAPTARNVDSAEVPTKREVEEGELKAREPAPALEEGAKPLEARSDAEVGEAVVQRSESETVLTARSEEPAAAN